MCTHQSDTHREKWTFFLFISILFFPYLFPFSSYAPYVYSKLNKIDDFHLIKINKQRKSSQFQLIELNYIYYMYIVRYVLRWLWYWPTILFGCEFRGSIKFYFEFIQIFGLQISPNFYCVNKNDNKSKRITF